MQVDENQLVAHRHDGDRLERRIAGIFEDRRPVEGDEALLIAPAAVMVPLGELLFRRARIVEVEERWNEADEVRVRIAYVEDEDARVGHLNVTPLPNCHSKHTLSSSRPMIRTMRITPILAAGLVV